MSLWLFSSTFSRLNAVESLRLALPHPSIWSSRCLTVLTKGGSWKSVLTLALFQHHKVRMRCDNFPLPIYSQVGVLFVYLLLCRNVSSRLVVCACMPHSSRMMLFTKISLTSALRLMGEAYYTSMKVRYLWGLTLTYLNNCETAEACMSHRPLWLRADNCSSQE